MFPSTKVIKNNSRDHSSLVIIPDIIYYLKIFLTFYSLMGCTLLTLIELFSLLVMAGLSPSVVTSP